MIVDDEPGMRLLACIHLEHSGFKLLTASDGKDCLRKLKNGCMPDLILLDIMMPKITGLEVCAKIKSKDFLKGIKVIYYTALPEEFVKIEVIKTGADGYIIKGDCLDEGLGQEVKKFLGQGPNGLLM